MKKQNFMKLALLALPLLTVLFVSGSASVTVFDGESIRYISWMETVHESTWGWCAPVAALLNACLFGMAVTYAVTKKQFWLKGIYETGFIAVCIAVLPIVIQSEIKIVPGVLGVLLIAAESVLAYLMTKKSEEKKEAKPKGKRLERR